MPGPHTPKPILTPSLLWGLKYTPFPRILGVKKHPFYGKIAGFWSPKSTPFLDKPLTLLDNTPFL